MPDNNPNNRTEQIDEVILRLLGLSASNELDYETYFKLIRKKLSIARMVGKELPAEEDELLREELKRVKGKEGRFKIRIKKVKVKQTDTNIPKDFSTQKTIGGAGKLVKVEKKKLEIEKFIPKESSTEENSVNKSLESIQKSLDSIANILNDENKTRKKDNEKERRKKENEKRKKKESLMEGAIKPIINAAKKFLAPLQSLWERIVRFVTFTLLGRAFNMFLEWSSDPKNKDKVKTLGRFLKDWWPALLGAFVLFATPLGGFIRTVVGTVAKLTLQLSKFAIPKLLRFMTSPAGIALGLATAGAWVPAVAPQTVNEQERKTDTAPGTKQDKIKKLESQKANLNFFEKLQGKGSEIDEQIYHLKTGKTKSYGGLTGHAFGGTLGWYQGYSKGGKPNFFSGIVNHNTGKTVSGAGPDTQLLPISGGGGVVLQKGESVLQVGARERMIKETGHDPLSYNVGSNANKPRNIKKGLHGNSSGGIVGYANGGVIGNRGLSTRGVQAGFTGMGKEGFEAISRGENFKLGKFKPQVLGRGAYSAPSINPEGWGLFSSKGAARYAGTSGSLGGRQTAGGVIKTIVPGGARRLNFLEPQAAVAPRTFDKGRVLANKLSQGQYANSALANRLRGQLTSGVATTAAERMAPLMKGLGGLMRIGGKFLEIGNLPVIGDMLFPEAVGESEPVMGPNGKWKIPKRKGGGIFTGLIKENSGMNLPGAGADRQRLDAQPGEYILPKPFVDMVGAPLLDKLVAAFDRNSNAAKIGVTPIKRSIPEPPIRKNSRNSTITLPPISGSSGLNMGSKTSKDRIVPPFSATSTIGSEVRKHNADLYGILG